ncbi:peroxiredoxin [Desulfobacula sp.]|uniref:peroxiredoxin n=1 Tax=Desulfobacula sp. TaxID=2593537 RepID=UPI0026296FA6|nr:peroxiredoxin [Desulfobacula sp.]
MNDIRIIIAGILIFLIGFSESAIAGSAVYGNRLYNPGQLKPVDSRLTVKIGEKAPDFTLPSLSGKPVRLSSFLGEKNVMLTFIPAAWTPVCSDQWPGYNIAKGLFDQYDTSLIGISVDNLPTLFAWTREMGGLWFDVLSDFWPHGSVSSTYGVLRTDGVSERAIFLIDKKGILRFIHVGDINLRPDLGMIVNELKKLN